jgi:hypothetical protein
VGSQRREERRSKEKKNLRNIFVAKKFFAVFGTKVVQSREKRGREELGKNEREWGESAVALLPQQVSHLPQETADFEKCTK